MDYLYVIVGHNIWGSGDTADEAKVEFGSQGGRLDEGYTLWIFPTQALKFTGVDFMGSIHWEGKSEPAKVDFPPKKK